MIANLKQIGGSSIDLTKTTGESRFSRHNTQATMARLNGLTEVATGPNLIGVQKSTSPPMNPRTIGRRGSASFVKAKGRQELRASVYSGHPVRDGVMEKKKSTGWRARTFRVAGHYLMYSDRKVVNGSPITDMQKNREIKGAIDLDHLAEIKLLHSKKYTIIQLLTDGENHAAGSIKLRVKSNEEAHQWVDAFAACMSEPMLPHEEEDQDPSDDRDADEDEPLSPMSESRILT